MPDPHVTPEWVRSTLAAHGCSQRHAAKLLGANERSMRRWCSGERPCTLDTARRLTQVLRTYRKHSP